MLFPFKSLQNLLIPVPIPIPLRQMSATSPIGRLRRRGIIAELFGHNRLSYFVRCRDVMLVVLVRERIFAGGGYEDLYVRVPHLAVGAEVRKFTVDSDVEDESQDCGEPVGFGFKPRIIKVGGLWSLAEGCGVSVNFEQTVGTYIPVIAKAVRAL